MRIYHGLAIEPDNTRTAGKVYRSVRSAGGGIMEIVIPFALIITWVLIEHWED